MSDTLPLLLSVALLWSAAITAPGPNLFVITRASLTNGRPTAITVALGMSLGAGVWGLAGFFRHALFTAAPWLYLRAGRIVWRASGDSASVKTHRGCLVFFPK